MFWLQHQFNNIVETTQLTNNQIVRTPLSLLMFEVFTVSFNTTLQSLWEVFHSFVDRSLWQVAPDDLKRLLEFDACFRLCFKLAISLGLKKQTLCGSFIHLYSFTLLILTLFCWLFFLWFAGVERNGNFIGETEYWNVWRSGMVDC